MEQPIVALLRQQGRRQTWLAQQIGYSQGYVYRVLQGVAEPAPVFRQRCSEVLGVPVDELFHGCRV